MYNNSQVKYISLITLCVNSNVFVQSMNLTSFTTSFSDNQPVRQTQSIYKYTAQLIILPSTI